VFGVAIVYPRFDPPAGWSSETEAQHITLRPPGTPAVMMLAYPVAARTHGLPSPSDWLDRMMLSEIRSDFVELGHGERTEVAGPDGLVGLAWEIVGGYGRPEDLIEKRTYVVFGAADALYPFALIASVATHAAHVEPFWRAVLSVRPYV
jgi:hypothetical protein